jgi:uncharacterized membrane protein YfcA
VEHDPIFLASTILAGMLAGAVNTLSGGGSYLVLPMLLGLGLDGHTANATNRVGVLIQNLVGIGTFVREKRFPAPSLKRFALPALLGAIAGASLAVRLDPRTFDVALGALMLLMFGLVLARPERFLREPKPANDSRPRTVFFMFLVGVHGGFIQAGVGILLLAVLVLDVGLDLVRANAAKLALVLIMTAPALIVFGVADQVDWNLGVLLAIGQSFGAFAAARFASRKADADVWIRRLLLVVLPATTVKLWFFS